MIIYKTRVYCSTKVDDKVFFKKKLGLTKVN